MSVKITKWLIRSHFRDFTKLKQVKKVAEQKKKKKKLNIEFVKENYEDKP